MRRFILITLAVAGSARVTLNAGPARHDQDNQLSVSQLGPDPFYALPVSLETMVKSVPAAVVAQILGPGTLQLKEVSVPGFDRKRVEGYVTYRVVIRDVVLHRQPEHTPSLTVGSQIDLKRRVGRDNAEAFMANRIPIVDGDKCLLFLWLGSDGWEMLNWHVQFRRSKELPNTAQWLGDSRAMKLTPEWLGGSVPVTVVGEIVKPDWDGLVGETRRLGKLPIAK